MAHGAANASLEVQMKNMKTETSHFYCELINISENLLLPYN
jgi:hypothetical protein